MDCTVTHIIFAACISSCVQVKPQYPSGVEPPAQFPSTAPVADGKEEPALSVPPEYPEQPQGRTDPDIVVEVYDPAQAYNGTTLIPDNHDISQPRIIEVNMRGEVVWEYIVPNDLKSNTNPGFDAETLSSGNMLAVFARKGVYEIDRDANRLPNGNTLITGSQAIIEVTSQGNVVWLL